MIEAKLSDVTEVTRGVWSVELPSTDVANLGRALSSGPGRSIVAVRGSSFSKDNRTLEMPFSQITVLRHGSASEAIIVDTGIRKLNEMNAAVLTEESLAFGAFISQCRQHLEEDKVTLVEKLLDEVRKITPFDLVEGNGRKWTAYPVNFLAITIQNRNQKFLISVKANRDFQRYKSILLKPSRPPYAEFHFDSHNQIPETVAAIAASLEY